MENEHFKPRFLYRLAERGIGLKKIIIITTDLTGGGAERVATNLATCLSKTEDVTLVVEHITGNTYGSTVNTIDLNMPLSKGKTKFFWHLKLARKLKKLKKELSVTHSISFLPEPSLANVLSHGKEKVIVSERNYLSAKRSRILHMKEQWLLKRSDMVVALSEMVRQDIVKNFGVDNDRTVTIYNPCYIDSIKERCQEDCMTEQEKQFFANNRGNIVITAGRLVDQKGQWHLVRAFSDVVKQNENAKLIILGQGVNQEYLERLISEMGLEGNVFLWGYKVNPYVYMANADIFVFPSLFEGLGNILVECMACELPVISTDCKYGPKELLAPGTDYSSSVTEITEAEFGILVPPMDGVKYDGSASLTNSEKKIAEAVVRLLSDESLRMKYKYVIKTRGFDFTPDNITKQWKSLLMD